MENRREFLRVRQNQQIDRALNDYMNWLTKAEEVIIEEEEREAQERTFIYFLNLPSSFLLACVPDPIRERR